jgi:hypothetical protein
MLKALKTILITTIIINSITDISGQELRGLASNPVIENAINKNGTNIFKVKSAQALLELPFFEDFSDYGPIPLSWPFPKAGKWSDNYAFINSEYADSMISVGVATLDAFDQNGDPYSLEKAIEGYSDTLTSNSFNINPTDTNVFLNFFYQAGGKGDKPELKDSLCVDFFSPKGTWINVWRIPGGNLQHVFTQNNISVPRSFLKTGFRFRFRNLTSNQNDVVDKQSNADQWHLDYIRLINTLQPDTLTNLNDAMVIEPLLPTLSEYSSVPYNHLDMARASGERASTSMVIRTLYPQNNDLWTLTRYHSSYDVVNKKLKERPGNGGIANTINSVEVHSFPDLFTPDMSYNPVSKSGKLELLSYFSISDPSQKTVNDTIRRTEYYSDYYAYDDGSAELGFGNSGVQQAVIYIANRYRVFRKSNNPDTLKAVYIYFNKTIGNTTEDIEFKICVWKNKGKVPGDLIYESSQPTTPKDPGRTHLNDFKRFDLEAPLLVSDTIFVGISQETTEFINIGFDININSAQNIFTKTSNLGWIESSFKGSLMIRPSFGLEDFTLGVNDPIVAPRVNVYPNPAIDFVNVLLPDEQRNSLVNIHVINVIGVTQFNVISDGRSIDISALQKGIYFMVVSSIDGGFKTTVKFFKN